MKHVFKAVSPVIATLLIILIAVASSAIMYFWVSGYAGSLTSASTEQTLREAVKTVETSEGTLIILWVRNIGDTIVKVNSAYYGTSQGYKQANLAYISSSPPIWGGDVWTFNRETQTIEKSENGLIFYEDFRDGYDPAVWNVEINTLDAGETGSKTIDPKYGLVLTLNIPSSTSDTDKYGIRSTDNIQIDDGKYVYEVAMGKLSGVNKNYLAESYLSPGPISGNNDPYYELGNYVMVEMRGSGVGSDIAIVKRYNWGTQVKVWSNEQNVIYVEWLLIFQGTWEDVNVYYNSTYVTDVWGLSRGVYEYPYIYLDIGVWRGESGVLKVYYPWIKIYKDVAFTVKNLSEGWKVLLMSDGNVLTSKTVPAGRDSVSFSKLDDGIVYPLDGQIVVVPAVDDASEIGYVIKPGEVRSVVLFITESLPESFSIKIATEDGVEAVFNVRR